MTAQEDSSPSASLSPTATHAPAGAEEENQLREKIMQLVEDRLKKAATIGAELIDKVGTTVSTKTGTFGVVEKIDVETASFVIKTAFGSKTVTVSEESSLYLLDKSRQEIALAEIETGLNVIVMGYRIENGAIDGRRVIFTNLNLTSNNRLPINGRIISVNENSLVVSSKNEEVALQFTNNSQLININKDTMLEPNQITENDTIFAIARIEKEGDKLTLIKAKVIKKDDQETVETSQEALPSASEKPSTCGDGECQNTACLSLDCPPAETVDNCPEDCRPEEADEDKQTSEKSPSSFLSRLFKGISLSFN